MMADAVREATGIEFRDVAAVEVANRHLGELNLPPEPTVGDAMVSIFEDRVAPRLLAPTLVTGHPVEISPLAKPMADDPRFAERFEIFIGGVECGDNWTEQNDPAQLLEFWQRGLRQAAETDAEFQPVDYDFLEALEHGMPPTTGIGPGIERMAMIFTGNENIDEVLFFPMMKPVLSAANRAIYSVREGGPGGGDTGEVVVTLEDLDALTAAGSLKPQTREILVRPRLRIWPGADGWRATGFLALEGFFIHKPLRVAGYSTSGEGRPQWDREAKRFHAGPAAQVADLLRARFPGRHVTLSEVAQEGANAPGD
jgi:lysyl-tRNA synthetase class 2